MTTIEPLDGAFLRERLAAAGISIELAENVDSTNARMIESGIRHAHALAAEAQSAGRGRRGRSWLSPPGGIYVSLGWHFSTGLSGLSALSLVAGLSAAETLTHSSGARVQVKWPNDLVIGPDKLGGCLVETGGSGQGWARAVIGIGINLQLDADSPIDQAWTCLARHRPRLGRNALLAELLIHLADDLAHFDRAGFAGFMDRWERLDALKGREITVIDDQGELSRGTASGVKADGRLRVVSDSGEALFSAGEVSIRGPGRMGELNE